MTPAAAGMNSSRAKAIQWDMRGFLQQCIDVYLNLAANYTPKLRKVV
jgi:hypothetical protein